MMMRLLMMICLMMTMLMPCTWAGITEDLNALQQQSAELLTSYQKQTEESALSQVTIESEDWVEGDTYYIRYTFTNPTDEMIDETVAYIQVSYHTYDVSYIPHTYHQYTKPMPHLRIEPHSAYTIIAALPLKEPAVIAEQAITYFNFSDKSTLLYAPLHTSTDISLHTMPIYLPSGKLLLNLKNNAYLTQNSTIENISLLTALSDKTGNMHIHNYKQAEPISLTMRPNDSISLPLMKNLPTDATLDHFHLALTINGIQHTFTDKTAYSLHPQTSFMPFITNILPTRLKCRGTMELTPEKLTCYLRIQNTLDHRVTLQNASIRTQLDYYDTDALLQMKSAHITIPNKIILPPNKEEFVSFSIVLPNDFSIYPNASLVSLSADGFYIPFSLIESYPKPLSSLQKHLYIDLGTTTAE